MTHPAVSLLADLIRRPSITPVEEGVLDVLEAFLAPLGFNCTRLKFEGDGSYPVDNLYATRKGSANSGPHLLFAGHTDVVPPGDIAAWTHDPFSGEIVDGMMWGRGATDMKSGVAAFCGAMAELVNSGALENGTVSLAITNDEEADAVNGTRKILEWADARGERFDFSIVGEPSSFETFGDSIKIGRRGSVSGRITVTGKQGHVAYPQRANNPMPVVAEIARALYVPLDEGTAHFQPTNLEVTSIDAGNPTANVIPEQASLRFNVRFNDNWTGETLLAEIHKRLGAVDARGTTIGFEQIGPVSRCFISPPEGHVAHLCDVMEAHNGIRPQLSTIGGTSDARFISQYCPVVECGLVGATMHQVNERVPVADVERLAAFYARYTEAFLSRGAQ
ncbi:succinyl-diaminopimelate desuccinylase [Pelagibacterium sp. 26DY04]|uniref:succinyl-diaminopimelate desuccinylase n=1 Tax=Pelagibacterium sp. 26DY04 TaxID=2967130 RepID=UPI0028155C85|nr:succinyl-diaminopimelate desuccinylase [Pelagibacterium sp. 26DY04]WMT87448.1 succinyl-diaminopimelate desuccinylase [Pelagibacterium sp. 26DY04]